MAVPYHGRVCLPLSAACGTCGQRESVNVWGLAKGLRSVLFSFVLWCCGQGWVSVPQTVLGSLNANQAKSTRNPLENHSKRTAGANMLAFHSTAMLCDVFSVWLASSCCCAAHSCVPSAPPTFACCVLSRFEWNRLC